MSLSDSTSQILEENLSLSEMLEIGVIGDPTYEEAIRNKISSLTHEELTVYFSNNPITEESFEKQRVLFQSPKIVFNFFEKIPADFRLSCFREAIQFLKSKETADKDEIACFGHAMDKLRAASDDTNYLNIAEFNGICKDFLVVLARQDDEYTEEIKTTLTYLESSPGLMIEALKEAFNESFDYKEKVKAIPKYSKLSPDDKTEVLKKAFADNEKAGFKVLISIVDNKYITPKEGNRSDFLGDLIKDIITERGLEERRESIAYLFGTDIVEVYYLNGIGLYVRDKRYLLKGDAHPDYYYTRTWDLSGEVVIKKISTAEISPEVLYDHYGPYTEEYGIPIDREWLQKYWPPSKPSSFVDLVLDESIPKEERWRISSQIFLNQRVKIIEHLLGKDFFTIAHDLNLKKIIECEKGYNECAEELERKVERANMNALICNSKDSKEIVKLHMAYDEKAKAFAKKARLTYAGDHFVRRTEFGYLDSNFDETDSITLDMNCFVITLPIAEKDFLLLETNDGEIAPEESYNDPKSFKRKYKDDLTELSSLYQKLVEYIKEYQATNSNYKTLELPENLLLTLSIEKALESREYTEDELAVMLDFLNKLNKKDDIVEAFPRLVECHPDLEKELLMISSVCLDGGMDLYNAYYSDIDKHTTR